MKKIVGALVLASMLPMAACTTVVAVRPHRYGLVLVEGRWIERPYANAVWVPGHWTYGPYNRVWIGGHWAY